MDGYKTSKESWVTGLSGSSIAHINLISSVAIVCSPSMLANYNPFSGYHCLSVWFIYAFRVLARYSAHWRLYSFDNADATIYDPLCQQSWYVCLGSFGSGIISGLETTAGEWPGSSFQSNPILSNVTAHLIITAHLDSRIPDHLQSSHVDHDHVGNISCRFPCVPSFASQV